jgi:citrate lyase subunit beta/citryl-CoA lyase
MIEQVRAAEAAGTGAAASGGVMLDAATARIFELVLERARLTGRLRD